MIGRWMLVFAFVIVGLARCWACERTDSLGFFWGETVHDFGEISASAGKVSCDFECVNNTDSAVVILGALASCRCTSFHYPKHPILPNDFARVRVSYDTTGRPEGPFGQDVVVNTTCGRICLKVKGVVVR